MSRHLPYLLTTEAAAVRLGVSVRTVRTAITSGRLAAVVVVGADDAHGTAPIVCYAIAPSDLDAYRAPRRGRPPKPPS